ncbi:hypothetical protein P153DRAFT_315039 [Dothidotthia symphoricarpi CBS 119687]|uniref:Uncharacterized protein n=1 Tax=Dothidotthia symphoricarpi CBS 119687 TaxID=1392245 RepID=A0A6A6AD99_9PLEO|nr:uncharacterized protein P153DRAFT_315039 [Dothidotthia symphoricarpi CBS 119687]KAF2129799.1 hypothetical protein P153DRAFT_315039 [Dothidotthia symphoricarpi CBS 119687]
MRRPPIVCRRAVQSIQSPALQHAWVPDDVLSLAVHRFFRISCPHQRRHGSNVPGPLEARRRATKRRMTASANFYPQDGFPPPLSLAALFGFRSSPQPSWRYEPPSPPKNVEPLDLPLDPPIPPSSVRQPASPSANDPHQSATPLSFSQNITQTAVPEPATALACETRVNDAPGTVDTSQSMSADPANDEHQVALMAARAANVEDELSCIPKAQIRARISAMAFAFAKENRTEAHSSNSTHVHDMDAWLKLLHRVDSRPASGVQAVSLVDTAVVPLAKLTFTKQIGPEALMKALLTTLVQRGAVKGVSVEQVFDFVAACVSPPKPRRRRSSPIDQLLENVILRMHAESIPYGGLLELALPLIVRYARIDPILEFLHMMEDRGLPLHDRGFIDKLLKKTLSASQNPNASLTDAQRQRHAFELHLCQKIQAVLTRLAAEAHTAQQALLSLQARREFQHILDRARDAHALPLACRSLTADIPTAQRVELIHQLAHHYSLDKTHSHRESWRAMYYLYHYLQRHSLPIGPLFTKAVVQVSLVRPLSENRFVSARRLIWVCRLVARVEGEPVARDIESAFWQWRGDLIRHAKCVFVGVGGSPQDKAHVGTMKRLGLI